MPEARFAARRTRSSRAGHLVKLTRCHQRTLSIIKGASQAKAWEVGMQAARLLRAYFPQEYAAAVGGQPATIPRLHGVYLLFLHLISTRYFPLSGGYNRTVGEAWERKCKSPRSKVDPLLLTTWDIKNHVSALSYNAEHQLTQARPLYIGLGRNLSSISDYTDTGRNTDNRRYLARALWLLVEETGWNVGVSREAIYKGVGKDRQRILNAMPRLPADTRMDLLEHVLWRTPELDRALRYACGQTPSPYANISMQEAYGLIGGSTFSFADRDQVEYIKEEYAPGPAYRAAFVEYAKQLPGHPSLVVELGQTIARAAEELAASPIVRGKP